MVLDRGRGLGYCLNLRHLIQLIIVYSSLVDLGGFVAPLLDHMRQVEDSWVLWWVSWWVYYLWRLVSILEVSVLVLGFVGRCSHWFIKVGSGG